MNTDIIAQYWQAYLDSLPPDSPVRAERYMVERFGDSAEMADELGSLVVQGIKTATCSSLWEWQAEGNPLPEAGLKTIVLNGWGEPWCIIETVEIMIRPFNEVDAQFAYEEGEGDRSLAYWREAHRRFFSRSLPRIGRSFDETMPLVCERFRVIYRGE
ncbi:MAG: ASCH domain-containing protein [Chloroflexota bacterium]|nr:MAG: ASCH domain-containing protein [Chloroflexota bacterium]